MDRGRNKRPYRPNGGNNHRNGGNKKSNNHDNGAEANSNGARQRNVRNNKTNEATKPIAYKTLEDQLKIENDMELILKLSSKMNGFLLLLDQQSIRPDLMCLILATLARASESSTELNTVQVLVHFFMEIIKKLSNQSNFYRELKFYIANLSNNCAIYAPQRDKHVKTVQNLLTFLRRMQSTIYQKSFDAISDLMQLITAQIDFINRKGNTLTESIMLTMNQLNDSVENFERIREQTEQNEILMEPPEDFRKIGIYPDTFDILNNHEPFIRKNVIDGKYVAGVDHYLDVQFRLLREDFVRPLRSGITQYRRIRNQPQERAATKFRINDLNIYNNVQIIGSKMMHNEQVHLCQFDCTPFRHIRWQFNKRMMNGSLICLSSDDFETFFFATVAGQRDPEKLAKGEFQMKLEMENPAMPEITPLITFVMVESQVYFEAYRHNLKVLQEFDKDNFPLEKYIVNVDKAISPPSYLSEDSCYIISNGLPDTDPDAKILSVDPLSAQWPQCEDFKLDESQYKAFRAALTKQMVVIQGPPGTGKTYIGLRIAEVLLANTLQWPILIVCYTNHALDQFLEGILKFCGPNEMVRIGGKSQCPALEAYNLSKIKSDMNLKRKVPQFIFQRRFESNSVLKGIQAEITMLEQNIEHISNTILGHELKHVIQNLDRNHHSQLDMLSQGRGFAEGILNWLGYVMKMDANQMGNNKNDKDDDNGAELFEEVIEEPELDEEEVKELERQRFIDDSSDEEIDDEVDDRISLLGPLNLDHVAIDHEDADGYKIVKNKRKSLKQEIKRQIKKSKTMPQEQAAAIEDINALLPNDRWNLYRLWVKLYTQEFKSRIKLYREQYQQECVRFNALRKQEDIEIVKKAKIIGMTTTGAAKYRHIIDGTRPKITIVEEAAEVLEAHIVTALCKDTDHLILIGDHLQLRPNPAVYELAKMFHLEISLFERLIKNGMEYHQLEQQHRMRPCISLLLVPHIYKQLLDHPSVKKYEDVKGISKNMFFLNHCQNEKTTQETRSHLNVFEAEFIVQLCRYVILQGYETSQVTILTTYSGQLHQIRQLMRSQQLLNGVRATVVDNYQGEECDIILLSFVRSNDDGNIGFLKDSHRVNVALSRARKGLYCIGNFDCLAEKSELWQKLMADLRKQQAIGNELEIYCQNHTDYKSLVSSKNDFDAAPEGGCSRPCSYRLPCGHSCPSVCHIIDIEHIDVYKTCHKNCDQIICALDHRCPKICHYGKDCGKCMTMVQKKRPECQHFVKVACFSNPSLAYCHNRCEKKRICGHDCKNICGAICESTACREMVKAKSPCGHSVTIMCSDAKNEAKLLSACNAKCNIELKCGHLCKGSCGQCKLGRLHISCKQKCSRILICGHPCTDTCSTECPPCKKKCTNACVHSKCSLLCGDPCPPCKEKCAWRCEHLQCSKLCCEPCDREICEHLDTRLIQKCGHQSIGVCGEEMPQLCRVCNKDEVEEIFFGDENEPDARFIELQDCKHIIEVNALINWMKSEPESDPNSNGNNTNSIQFKKCPKCNTIIRHTRSLNTATQASLKDIQQVKLKTCGDEKTNRKTQENLFIKVNELLEVKSFNNDKLQLRSIFEEIRNDAELKKNRRSKSNQALIQLNNKFDLLERLQQIYSVFDGRNQSQKNLDIKDINTVDRRLRMAASFIRTFRNCEQQRADISIEISFLQLMSDVIVKASSHHAFNDAAKEWLNRAFEFANQYGSANESIRNEFKRMVNESWKLLSGIGISMEEKQMVLQAMGLSSGHWYKCPNGHVYAIGQCGGAMERSKCPDCGATIGGESHRLVSNNAVATEMDGATRPAWPQ